MIKSKLADSKIQINLFLGVDENNEQNIYLSICSSEERINFSALRISITDSSKQKCSSGEFDCWLNNYD